MVLARVSLVVVSVLCACSVVLTQGPPGIWVRSPGRGESYIVSDQEMNWGDAWDHCVQIGGHLLILDTEEEVDFIRNFLEFYGLNNTYVGLHDHFKSGKYTTIFGQPMSDTAFTWSEPEPSGGDQHCVGLHGWMGAFDIVCDYKLQFICEKAN